MFFHFLGAASLAAPRRVTYLRLPFKRRQKNLTFKRLSELNLLRFYNTPLGLVSLERYQMALSFALVNGGAGVFRLGTYTHPQLLSQCVLFPSISSFSLPPTNQPPSAVSTQSQRL